MPAKTTKRTTDKPAKVGFNFDTYQRDEPVDPFVIVLDGQRYESIDPLDLDYRALGKLLDQPDAFFQELFPDDHEKILASKSIKLGALAKFVQAITKHFGLEDFIGAPS